MPPPRSGFWNVTKLKVLVETLTEMSEPGDSPTHRLIRGKEGLARRAHVLFKQRHSGVTVYQITQGIALLIAMGILNKGKPGSKSSADSARVLDLSKEVQDPVATRSAARRKIKP